MNHEGKASMVVVSVGLPDGGRVRRPSMGSEMLQRRRQLLWIFMALVAWVWACSGPAGVVAPGTMLTVYSVPQGYQPSQAGAQGIAVVREVREVHFQAGLNTFVWDEVAASIEGTTVQFKSLSDPDTKVLDQVFAYDLVSADAVLAKYIGATVTLFLRDGQRLSGRLLQAEGQSLLLDVGGATPIELVNRYAVVERIALPELPAGLRVRPALVWTVEARRSGRQMVEVAYQSSGVGWTADYQLFLEADRSAADLLAWVTLDNRSGATFRDTGVKLVAGDVQVLAPPVPPPALRARDMLMVAESTAQAPAFVEKTFFEYHLYTLQRRTTLPNDSNKQIELFAPVRQVPVRFVYRYDAAKAISAAGGYGGDAPDDVDFYEDDAWEGDLKAWGDETGLGWEGSPYTDDDDDAVFSDDAWDGDDDLPLGPRAGEEGGESGGKWGTEEGAAWSADEAPRALLSGGPSQRPRRGEATELVLKIVNDEASGLGIPLPAGRVRLQMVDEADDAIVALGTAYLEHTPRNESLALVVGRSRAVTVTRTQTHRAVSEAERWSTEGYSVSVANGRSEAVEVEVWESLTDMTTWHLEAADVTWHKVGAKRVLFPLRLEPGAEVAFSYTVRKTW